MYNLHRTSILIEYIKVIDYDAMDYLLQENNCKIKLFAHLF